MVWFIAAAAARDCGGPSYSLASVPMSPCTAAEEDIYVKLKDHINSINQLEIACDILEQVDNWDKLSTKLLDLPVGSINDVLLELGIPTAEQIPGSSNLSKFLNLLTTETEAYVQTSLNQSEAPDFLDTHLSNVCAKSACVSEPDPDDNFFF